MLPLGPYLCHCYEHVNCTDIAPGVVMISNQADTVTGSSPRSAGLLGSVRTALSRIWCRSELEETMVAVRTKYGVSGGLGRSVNYWWRPFVFGNTEHAAIAPFSLCNSVTLLWKFYKCQRKNITISSTPMIAGTRYVPGDQSAPVPYAIRRIKRSGELSR